MSARPRAPGKRRGKVGAAALERLGDEELLDLRFKDLDLPLASSRIAPYVARLEEELERAGLRFRPYVWASTDWFTPDGLTGFAVPFYLLHKRLARLEASQMLEVEGGEPRWCMRLLRHEVGHAIDFAYRIHQRKDWRAVFGRWSEPYRGAYQPRPTSKDHVQHLDYWYAQSHPGEDWAETFAVWLAPRSDWRRRYRGWPAKKKLEYVDAIMSEIGDARPLVRTRSRPDQLSGLGTTLRAHYRAQKARYRHELPHELDNPLRRLFDSQEGRRGARAATFLQRERRRLVDHVNRLTRIPPYVIDQLLHELILRARALDLRVTSDRDELRIGAAILLTSLADRFLAARKWEYHR